MTRTLVVIDICDEIRFNDQISRLPSSLVKLCSLRSRQSSGEECKFKTKREEIKKGGIVSFYGHSGTLALHITRALIFNSHSLQVAPFPKNSPHNSISHDAQLRALSVDINYVKQPTFTSNSSTSLEEPSLHPG